MNEYPEKLINIFRITQVMSGMQDFSLQHHCRIKESFKYLKLAKKGETTLRIRAFLRKQRRRRVRRKSTFLDACYTPGTVSLTSSHQGLRATGFTKKISERLGN